MRSSVPGWLSVVGTAEHTAERREAHLLVRRRAVRRIRFIKRAQALGFTLEKIGDLLDLPGRRRSPRTGSPGGCCSVAAQPSVSAAVAELLWQARTERPP